MIFQQKQIHNFLLSEGIESFVSATVSEGLDGALSTGTAVVTDEQGDSSGVRLDGAMRAADWPAFYEKMSQLPARMLQLEDMPTAGGNVEFTLVISNEDLSAQETQEVTGVLHEAWFADEVDAPAMQQED